MCQNHDEFENDDVELPKCQGHEPGPFGPIGVTGYCDGSCVGRPGSQIPSGSSWQDCEDTPDIYDRGPAEWITEG